MKLNHKKGSTHSLNITITVFALLLLGAGIYLLHITADQNIIEAKELSAVEADYAQAMRMLTLLSKLPIETSKEEITLAQALNNIYVLEEQTNPSTEEKKYKNELIVEVKKEAQALFAPYTYIEVTADLYTQNYNMNEEIELYYGGKSSPTYLSSILLPSSLDKEGNYYINISMYFHGRNYLDHK